MSGPSASTMSRAYRLHLPGRREPLILGGGARGLVMGVLNITVDSFSDGGLYLDRDAAVAHGQALVAEGVDLIDIGAESTRPGSESVAAEEQINRVVPVIEQLASRVDVPISIDTASAVVARRAIEAGATMVNDVTALRGDVNMARLVAEAGVPVILMHMQGTPRTMQDNPAYDDVVGDITAFLRERLAAAESAGVSREQTIIDVGFGFGKTLEHNLTLLRRLNEFCILDRPLLVGTSRKAMLGAILDVPPDGRLYGTLATVAAALDRGAAIVRVHDVRPALDVARVVAAIQGKDWA